MSDQIDVNELSNAIQEKMDLDMGNLPQNIDFVVDSQMPTASNNYKWYRLYKSGWVEQGGIQLASSSAATLPVEMADTNYTVLVSCSWETSTSSGTRGNCIYDKTTTGFKGQVDNNSGTLNWEAKGMSAQGGS